MPSRGSSRTIHSLRCGGQNNSPQNRADLEVRLSGLDIFVYLDLSTPTCVCVIRIQSQLPFSTHADVKSWKALVTTVQN